MHREGVRFENALPPSYDPRLASADVMQHGGDDGALDLAFQRAYKTGVIVAVENPCKGVGEHYLVWVVGERLQDLPCPPRGTGVAVRGSHEKA